MGARLTVRQGIPFLFSRGVAVFSTKEEAQRAIEFIGNKEGSEWIYPGGTMQPQEFPHGAEGIRESLRKSGFKFNMPHPIETIIRVGSVPNNLHIIMGRPGSKSDGKRRNRIKPTHLY